VTSDAGNRNSGAHEPSYTGRAVCRLQDADLLRGHGRFGDDLPVRPDTLHTAILRSPHAPCRDPVRGCRRRASVVMPLLESVEVSAETKRRIADLVVQQGKLIAGNFSEPVTTSLIGERPLKARARRADSGYRVTGRKMFASMLEAADFVLVMAHPDEATSPSAGIILMLPRGTEGRSVDPNWDVLGMRATRSDSLILEECWLPDSAAVFQSDDMQPFRHRGGWLQANVDGATLVVKVLPR
jgi:hypothetical protein